ncbi:dihydrofolate reductase [Nesterenkonia sp.]|uniref:dihydrofolate reductase n=1 Tax=Nesterenkonia sp. TaxID=704201 RepID=UPI00262D0BBB|nr:dihydrofolate reductase [Nesterenkonia sp.]
MTTTPPASAVVGVIWAQTTSGVIGAEGTMPWHVPEDLAYFKQVTHGCPMIMGRRTWESLPEAYRPLPGRTNIVVTSNTERAVELGAQGALTAESLEEAVATAAAHTQSSSAVWIMGGGSIYAEALEKNLARVASITQLDLQVEGDTYAPELDPEQWQLISSAPEQGWQQSESGIGYRFETYARR